MSAYSLAIAVVNVFFLAKVYLHKTLPQPNHLSLSKGPPLLPVCQGLEGTMELKEDLGNAERVIPIGPWAFLQDCPGIEQLRLFSSHCLLRRTYYHLILPLEWG